MNEQTKMAVLLGLAILVAIVIFMKTFSCMSSNRENLQSLPPTPQRFLTPDEARTRSYPPPLTYLQQYEEQDRYKNMPSIWPVTDNAITAEYTLIREENAKI